MVYFIELSQFNITSSSVRRQFNNFLKKYLINTYKRLIINNRKSLDEKLNSMSITAMDLYNNLGDFILITNYTNGVIVSFEKDVYINKFSMLGIIKCLDFGSTITGTPYPIFTPVIKALRKNIESVYKRFIGLN